MDSYHSLLKRQLKRHFGDGFTVAPEWKEFLSSIDTAYRESDTDREMLDRSMELSSQELVQANSEMRAVFQAIPDLLFVLDSKGAILSFKGVSENGPLRHLRDLFGKRLQDTLLQHVAQRFDEAFQRVRQEQAMVMMEHTLPAPNGEGVFETRLVPLRDGQVVAIMRDITKRKEAEAELERVHLALMESSRKTARMAETATGVLHNVSNVLNSIKIASELVAGNLSKSRVANLARVVTMVQEHQADLATFLTTDPRGKLIPAYLAELAEHMAGERSDMLKELDGLRKNIEHIKEVVGAQQTNAKVTFNFETLSPVELVEDALRMTSDVLDHNQIRIVREFSEVPLVQVDKHKVLQVLVNLVRNAKHALEEGRQTNRQLTIRIVMHKPKLVSIIVTDNGIGIPADNLARIFEHGFTTRRDGHGFGLHSSAIVVKELRGNLVVESDGPGQGATFTLELPAQPARPSLSNH